MCLRQESENLNTFWGAGPSGIYIHTHSGKVVIGIDRRIDSIEFPAGDLEIARTFYSAVFGWSFQDYGPDYCAFQDAGLDGGFYRAPLRASAPEGSALVVIYADDLEATLERVTGTAAPSSGRSSRFRAAGCARSAPWSSAAERGSFRTACPWTWTGWRSAPSATAG
jgi:hypothetical protein